MYRVKEISKIINAKSIDTLLDVGCRDCVLQRFLKKEIQYEGNDLFQNSAGTVKYIGDINGIQFEKQFDCITAVDILEHVDDPYTLFDSLIKLSKKLLIINLPNCYDLKSKMKFLIKSDLGEKYKFGTENSLDRHRWIMSYNDILSFYNHMADKHNCKLSVFLNQYGDKSLRMTSIIGNMFRFILSKQLSTESLIGVFEKKS